MIRERKHRFPNAPFMVVSDPSAQGYICRITPSTAVRTTAAATLNESPADGTAELGMSEVDVSLPSADADLFMADVLLLLLPV